ncbi:MAG TPA: VWA domain-containing protein [Vicinamibacterales bacterium]|jgi:Ca-activated chloride channel family protein|nr:VWA domain-containing protein [Vicinamibacterales bacterium]
MNIDVQADRTLVRMSGNSTRYALLSFTAPEPARTHTREPVNVAFVIDRSGSMGGEKIRLAREAVVQALRMLRPADRFAVVMYDNEIEVVVSSTEASTEAVRNAITQVERIQARGNTNLAGGWLKGCEEIAGHLRSTQISRCVLLTDGLANEGITDRNELARHSEELRARGITTTTIGLGADFDEELLEALAHAGGGHFYFIERAVQIGDCLTSELGETLETVARDVVVSVRPDAGVTATALNRFRVSPESDGAIAVSLGDLVSRQEVSLVFKLVFPPGQQARGARVLFSVADGGGVLGAADADLVWTFDDHAANDAQRRNVAVDREVAKLYAAKAMAQALELNRAGKFKEAAAVLEKTGNRIMEYAGNDQELLAIIASLRQRESNYAMPMPTMALKQEHFASRNMVAMRSATGKARRRPDA